MDIERLTLLLLPAAGIVLMLIALRIHDRMTGFPSGKGKRK